jgi:hypothetical protein
MNQTIELNGSDVYCHGVVVSGDDYISCALEKGGFGVARSYTFAIGDKGLIIGQVESTGTMTLLTQPQPALKLGAAPKAPKSSNTLTLKLGSAVAVGGTHVVLGATDIAKGEPGLIAGITGSNGKPLNGTYVAEISAKRIAISRWGAKPTIVYEKSQP